MSTWNDIKKPFDKAFNSTAFKAVFPVNALANGVVQGATKLANIGGNNGLTPSDQYGIGAAGGATIAGGAALMGGSSAAPAGAGESAPASASPWESHASPMRFIPQSSNANNGQNIYDQKLSRNPMPQMPSMMNPGLPDYINKEQV